MSEAVGKRALGTPYLRVDALSKTSGRARYTDDLPMPGMHYAKYVRSTIAHGMVTSVDASQALAMPGVVAVFTCDDVPQIPFATAGHAWSLEPAKRDVADRLLLNRHVRHHGDGVAIVVARD